MYEIRKGSLNCVSMEGNTELLRKGLKLMDEKGNIFEIETVGMTKYQNVEDHKKYADVILYGDIDNIGSMLSVDI